MVAFAALLLVAGHETTANMIGLSALTLMRDRESADRPARRTALIRGAVEELLRYHGIVDVAGRAAPPPRTSRSAGR
ncbi:Mycinamicin VIII C21 methyl hydroxylase [Streptomyces rimosus subsp. rimosus]